MKTGTTLFQLKTDRTDVFDGSTLGVSILAARNAKRTAQGGLHFDGGVVELARNKALDELQAFTIEAMITPERIAGERRNILEAQTPAVALFLEPGGKLVGSVHTAAGWERLDSGPTVIREGETARVRFTRGADGKSELEINGSVAAAKMITGPLQDVGTAGFKIGSWVDGARYPFVGRLDGVQILHGAASAQLAAEKTAAARQIGDAFRAKTGLSRVVVELMADPSRARLQAVRDLMNAAGVQKLSDLSTLRITQPTVMTPGKVLLARRASAAPKIEWSRLAASLVTSDAAARRLQLAQSLTNRNSAAVLKAAQAPAPTAAGAAVATTGAGAAAATTFSVGGHLASGTMLGRLNTRRLPAEVLSASPTLRMELHAPAVSEVLRFEAGRLHVLDSELVTKVESANPALWPVGAQQEFQLLSLNTIPVDTAVIIANTLDLTNTELVVEPSVTRLYIIAEEVTCSVGARITWRRPGIATPPRLDNPDLDGRGWSGVHTRPNSRHGLDGQPGRPGDGGIGGARGTNAPELEMWVKRLSAIPDLDLNGEDGRAGGHGQKGGRGGNGANGRQGERLWAFGWHCTADPGDGGHGGDGGDGGPGGYGGSGGNGANITIGVLEGTLAETVTSKSFKIKNHGGQRGPGGEGGAGGAGGAGGRSGAGETCKNARDGRGGAQGQPGRRGADGASAGTDGEMRLFEFDEEDWDALLTRPWLSQITPTEAFPGDRVTLRGSRFSSSDQVMLGGAALSPTINADESVSITVPLSVTGGDKPLYVRRADGTESNRLNLGIKPQLDPLTSALAPNVDVSLAGRAFVAGAAVLIDGAAVPANVASATALTFRMPGTGGAGSAGGTVGVQVRNPDGRVSNARTASRPRVLELPFRYGVHNLGFKNFDDGVPSWQTYEETFGKAEVWHELLDPVFGHPVLTGAFYAFYEYFLKGKGKGGLATGFCTSLASLVADKFWNGDTDATAVTKDSVHRFLTALHGKLLSRESLIHFHDQGRAGIARVELTAREIEATLLRGCDRQNAPLLFFIPAGAAWDEGYFDRVSSAHCVMPYKFVYPGGHPGPQLAPGGALTTSSLNGVEMYVWDCNQPESANCKLALRMQDGQLHFDYFPGSTRAQFSSTDRLTLGMMTHGQYMLSDHDLPFSGPLGLTRFVIDFLLSPADLQVTDGLGLRTGNFGGQILAEIPDSHPCYLVPGMYMLPAATALTRRIRGTGAGKYSYHSVIPGGGSLALQDLDTAPGQEDVLAVNEDATQIRFSPAANKAFHLTLARQVGGQARAVSVRGVGAAPGADVDIALSPELSVVRVGNRGAARTMEVRAFTIDRATNTPLRKQLSGVSVPAQHDLVVAVPDWGTLNVNAQALAFE